MTEIKLGDTCVIRYRRLLVPVRIEREDRHGRGWCGLNLITNGRVLVRRGQRKRLVNPADPHDLVVRLSDDGRWRWFDATGADTEVSAATLLEAWRHAQLAWHSWDLLPTGPFTAVLLRKG